MAERQHATAVKPRYRLDTEPKHDGFVHLGTSRIHGLRSCGMKMRRLRKRLMQRQRAGVVAAAWAFKRAGQKADMAAMAAGRITQEELAWFSRGKTRGLRIIGAPY